MMTEMSLVIFGVSVGFVATLALLVISEAVIRCRRLGK